MRVSGRTRATAVGLGIAVAASVLALPGPTASASSAADSALTQDAISAQVEAFFRAVDAHSISPVVGGDAADLRLTANGAAKFASFVANTELARDDMAANGVANEHVTTTVTPYGYIGLGDVVGVQATVATAWLDDNPQPGIPADSSSSDEWLVDVRNVGGQWLLDDAIGVPTAAESVEVPSEIPDAASLGLLPSDATRPATIPIVDKQAGTGLDLGVDRGDTAGGGFSAQGHNGYQGPLYGLNYSAMAGYAKYWSGKTSSGADRYNSNYTRYDNDCTNFVSQALRAGSWPYKDASADNYKSYHVWDYDVSWYWDSSYTWRVSGYLASFTKSRSWHLSSIWYAGQGDVLMTDWDPNGRADGKIDHAMIVSARDSNGPRISQHSRHRSNITLQYAISLAKNQGRTSIDWYGFRT